MDPVQAEAVVSGPHSNVAEICPTAAALTPCGVAVRLLVSNEAADGDS